MKIKIELDQKAMSKSRKFVYFMSVSTLKLTDCMTTVQAKIVSESIKQLGIEIENNTGLTF